MGALSDMGFTWFVWNHGIFSFVHWINNDEGEGQLIPRNVDCYCGNHLVKSLLKTCAMDIEMIVGIDPGVTGGIAINDKGKHSVHKMPGTINEIDGLLRYCQSISSSMLVIIEDVRIYPGDMSQEGKAYGRMLRMQKLMNQYSEMKSAMKLAGIPYKKVQPSSWQKYLNLRPDGWKKMTSGQRKNVYRKFAQANFQKKVILSVADSVCLMIYGQRRLKYDPDFVNELPKELTDKLF